MKKAQDPTCKDVKEKKLYGFIRKDEALPPLHLVGDVAGKEARTPLEGVEARAARWKDRWTRDKAEQDKLIAAMHMLDELAGRPEHRREPISSGQVEAARKQIKDDAGKGPDQVTGPWLGAVAPQGQEDLAKLLTLVEEEHVWPWQLTIVWTAMLPKDQKGDQERPICLLAQLVRLWNVIRKPVGQTWSAGLQAHWDKAIKGSSALRAALARAVKAESALAKGFAVAGTFVDWEKFYDNTGLCDLFWEAFKHRYHPLDLLLAVQYYLGPRFIKVSGCLSEAIIPFNSLAAGCGQAKNFTTALLYDMLEEAHKIDPLGIMRVDQYVDDLSQVAAGSTRQVAGALSAGMSVLKKGSKRLRLTFSVKTTMVASSQELEAMLDDDLTKQEAPHTVGTSVMGCRC